VALTAVVACAVVSSSGAAGGVRPTDRDQALRDGCQRPSFANLTLVNSPEWVYVNRDSSVHFAQGVTRVPHPTPVDQPGTHDWFDFNGNLVPDRRYRYLVAGGATAGTNNFSGRGSALEQFGRLHYEWEEGSLPKFAWPSDGDRTSIWGSWIWDCGHWTEGGQVTGERTEFHPLIAIVVTRGNPWQARAGESETDAFISSDGTSAHASEQCALRLHAQPNGTYGPGFFGCARDAANFRQPLARSYTFLVPAPSRPAQATTLLLRSVTRVDRGRVSERIRRTATGFVVTVTPQTKTLAWGKSYFARWSGPAPAVTRLEVTFRTLLIRHADPDPTEGGVDPAGEKWALYLELNGDWVLVNDWAPAVFAAKDDLLIRLNRTIPVTLQPGRQLNLFVMGRECDGPSGVTLFGHFVPATKPCPFNTTESKISAHNNDDPGTVLDRYRSVGAALGVHTAQSRPTVVFAGTGPITFFDGNQGNDDYELTYRVSSAPPAGLGFTGSIGRG
jgi:hypothetical protein